MNRGLGGIVMEGWGAGFATGIGVGWVAGFIIGRLLKTERAWSELSDREKNIRISIIAIGSILLFTGMVIFLIR